MCNWETGSEVCKELLGHLMIFFREINLSISTYDVLESTAISNALLLRIFLKSKCISQAPALLDISNLRAQSRAQTKKKIEFKGLLNFFK